MSTFLDENEETIEAMNSSTQGVLTPETAAFYRAMVDALGNSGIPFLVGGAYAFARYTGIERHTKDFDIFVQEQDVERAMMVLRGAGCATELTFPHWLGKAYCGEDFVDVIFSSGNGLVKVDEDWFTYAIEDEVLGLPVRLIPPEEMLRSKAFVMERERYDGADINHLLRATAATLDWARLLQKFDDHWQVLFSHLTLFAYVYPAEARNIPGWVVAELHERSRLAFDPSTDVERVCRGPFISRAQYLVDMEKWGYRDPRLHVHGGSMTKTEVVEWTEAIEQSG